MNTPLTPDDLQAIVAQHEAEDLGRQIDQLEAVVSHQVLLEEIKSRKKDLHETACRFVRRPRQSKAALKLAALKWSNICGKLRTAGLSEMLPKDDPLCALAREYGLMEASEKELGERVKQFFRGK